MFLQFLQNQGFLASVSSDNEIQVSDFFLGSIQISLLSSHDLLLSCSYFSFADIFINIIGYWHNWQVWDLESRGLASALQWESNITAFFVIYGTSYMYSPCITIVGLCPIWSSFTEIMLSDTWLKSKRFFIIP